jgi:hypothetical protein
LNEIKENQIEELKKFHKANFDADSIVNTASEMKYTIELKHLLQQELVNPSSDFVKHFAKQVYPSVVTAKVLDQFTNLTKKSIQQYVSDLITERLKTALTKEDETAKNSDNKENSQSNEDENKIVTTEEEIEAFLIVKTILRQQISLTRIAYRDAQSYFAILLDNNNRKTICRLYLNGNKKQIGLFDENKKEFKTEILSLDDIFNHSNSLLKAIEQFDKLKEQE